MLQYTLVHTFLSPALHQIRSAASGLIRTKIFSSSSSHAGVHCLPLPLLLFSQKLSLSPLEEVMAEEGRQKKSDCCFAIEATKITENIFDDFFLTAGAYTSRRCVRYHFVFVFVPLLLRHKNPPRVGYRYEKTNVVVKLNPKSQITTFTIQK